MNAIEIVAFVVAAVVCLLPGIMAWSNHVARRTAEKKSVLTHAKPAVGKAF